MKTPLHCLLPTPPPPPPPPFLFQILSNTTQTCSFCSLISLAECVIMPHLTYYLLNDNMDLNLLSLGTLVPAARCFVFYLLRHQIYWRFGTNDTVFGSSIICYCTHRLAHTGGTSIIDWTYVHTAAEWMNKLLYRSRLFLTVIINFFLSPKKKGDRLCIKLPNPLV